MATMTAVDSMSPVSQAHSSHTSCSIRAIRLAHGLCSCGAESGLRCWMLRGTTWFRLRCRFASLSSLYGMHVCVSKEDNTIQPDLNASGYPKGKQSRVIVVQETREKERYVGVTLTIQPKPTRYRTPCHRLRSPPLTVLTNHSARGCLAICGAKLGCTCAFGPRISVSYDV
jgi:hypothetical protein